MALEINQLTLSTGHNVSGFKEKGKAVIIEQASNSGIKKVATNINGLDAVLKGGVPQGRSTLVFGGAGCGKSVLGLEILYRGALKGDPGVFIAFEESIEAIRNNSLGFGWRLADLERGEKIFMMNGAPDPEAFLSGDFNLKGLLGIIRGKATEMGAKLIVIDAIDLLLRLFDDIKRMQDQIYALNDWLTALDLTSILTAKTSAGEEKRSQHEFLEFMADCVIYLDHRVTNQVSTRRLRVIKYRGAGVNANEHPFVISKDGVNIIPLSEITLLHKPMGPKISSGLARLDTILYGGYRRGACILITGVTGSGKTSLASAFIQAAAGRGERGLYISFEESEQSLAVAMASVGIDFSPMVKAGNLLFMTFMPETLSAEEHLLYAFRAIEQFQPEHVVVDAISSCARMGSQNFAFEYVMRLVNRCKERGITILLTADPAGFFQEHEISGIGVSWMVDTLIFMKLYDTGCELNRMLLVAKACGSNHSMQYHQFLLTDQGIDILEDRER